MSLEKLERTLGYSFQNKDLLRQALVHPSKGYESRKRIPDNQRLEFLGDAVLQLALTVSLFNKMPNEPEGPLTKLRARLVNRETLAKVACSLNLGDFLELGKGEERNQGRQRTSNLADAMEAVIGSIYLDSDFPKASRWITNLFEPWIRQYTESSHTFNPKGELQEFLQSQGRLPPTYETTEESGPDHNKAYLVAARLGEEILGTGEGSSKKAAEMEAAKKALEKLKNAS